MHVSTDDKVGKEKLKQQASAMKSIEVAVFAKSVPLPSWNSEEFRDGHLVTHSNLQ